MKPRLLKGFRDYLPEHMIPRQRMLDTIRKVFESFGFAPLATPALEYYEVLTGHYGSEGEKLLFEFEDHGNRRVALRYDLTVPLARVVGTNRELESPFRRYHIGQVWRAEKPAKGRFREFTQCDVDIVGTSSLAADAECLAVDVAVLKALGITGFTVKVNHRGVLDGLLDDLGLTDDEDKKTLLRALDKLDKIGRDKVLAMIVEAFDEGTAEGVATFLALDASTDALEARFEGSAVGSEAVRQLRRVITLAEAWGVGEHLQVDTSIARGLDYYTGTVFETVLDEHPEYGSVMSGGRYDGLVGRFAGREVPAVGISLGIDRLVAALLELGLMATARSVSQILVTSYSDELAPKSLEVASRLRSRGLRVEVYPDPVKLGKQFKYANKKGIPYVAVVGPDEAARGEVTVKDMATGDQSVVPIKEVGHHVAAEAMS